MVPGILYFVIFKYVPMWGALIAFKNYQPFLGFFGSEWVGLMHFRDFFTNPDFFMLLRNTLILSFMNLVFFFPLPIILALLLNEIRHMYFKRIAQTFIYVPHFVSMVIVASITYTLLNTESGVINNMLLEFSGEKIHFLSATNWFRPLILIQIIWKETGWGTIIFLAALAGVDTELYEAATVDGANRFQQLIHITLPSITGIVIVMFILRTGSILDTGFEQIYLMANALNRSVAQVFDTYVYQLGINQGAFSYSTAVGLFKSVVGTVLVLTTNYVAKKLGHSGLY
jgi:putative aldouronate transport system permease protein